MASRKRERAWTKASWNEVYKADSLQKALKLWVLFCKGRPKAFDFLCYIRGCERLCRGLLATNEALSDGEKVLAKTLGQRLEIGISTVFHDVRDNVVGGDGFKFTWGTWVWYLTCQLRHLICRDLESYPELSQELLDKVKMSLVPLQDLTLQGIEDVLLAVTAHLRSLAFGRDLDKLMFTIQRRAAELICSSTGHCPKRIKRVAEICQRYGYTKHMRHYFPPLARVLDRPERPLDTARIDALATRYLGNSEFRKKVIRMYYGLALRISDKVFSDPGQPALGIVQETRPRAWRHNMTNLVARRGVSPGDMLHDEALLSSVYINTVDMWFTQSDLNFTRYFVLFQDNLYKPIAPGSRRTQLQVIMQGSEPRLILDEVGALLFWKNKATHMPILWAIRRWFDIVEEHMGGVLFENHRIQRIL